MTNEDVKAIEARLVREAQEDRQKRDQEERQRMDALFEAFKS